MQSHLTIGRQAQGRVRGSGLERAEQEMKLLTSLYLPLP